VQGNCSSNHYNALSWARALGAIDGKSASSAWAGLENPYVFFDIPHEQRHYQLGQYKNRTTVRKAQIMVIRAFRHDGVLHRSGLETLDSVCFIENALIGIYTVLLILFPFKQSGDILMEETMF
jgi:hypothetical protein